ncbi:response regulator [Brevundimonas sp.]|jgi:DNA-binding NtrC family response regulator|uniref:response regulator n=1 Tax=Brevundimonas sp. TaxID=1871086 RepID=UPI002ED7DED0
MLSAAAEAILVGQDERPCILVVEDEVLIRWMVSETMREFGYTVIEASTGDEALEIVEGGVRVDLVFSDVRMPGSTDGLALLAKIKLASPGLPVVITSGHCDPALAIAGGAAAFVRKPYEADVVAAVISAQLPKP